MKFRPLQPPLRARAAQPRPPTDPTILPQVAFATKTPYRLTFDEADKMKNAYHFGRWMTASGRFGPWSALAQLSIAG